MTDSTGELLMAAARRLRRAYAEALIDADVSPGQARALRAVLEDGAVRPSALAERLRIAPRSATEVIDALEERGLVAREPDPDDRRATLVRPTDAASSQLALVDRLREAQNERFLADLSERDRAALARILRRLVDQS